MKIFCCTLAMLVLVSTVKCLYIQNPHEMQALTNIGQIPAASVPGQKTVIITGNPAQPTQYRTYVDPNVAYGPNTMARGSTVVINVAEEQDPYYAASMPARTIRV